LKCEWQGDLYDNESLVKAMKQVDVVISALSHTHAADQVKIIAAIKEAGSNVKVILILFFFCIFLFLLFTLYS